MAEPATATEPSHGSRRAAGEVLRGPVAFGACVTLLAVVLAYLEVQIEGAHGWAADLHVRQDPSDP